MKVDVIEVSEAGFGRFSWWSNWVDVAVFDYGSDSYLIQMKVSRKNKKKFRNTKLSGRFYQLAEVSLKDVGNLTQMKKGDI